MGSLTGTPKLEKLSGEGSDAPAKPAEFESQRMNLPPELAEQIEAATSFVRKRWDRSPRFGVILGTGAGELAEAIEAEEKIPYGEIPHFAASTATGHKGQFVCGKLAGADVIAMEGRFHLYEGYPVDQATLPVHLMHAMGVEVLFVSNASGGINPRYRSGQIMLIESHHRSNVSLDYRDGTSNL